MIDRIISKPRATRINMTAIIIPLVFAPLTMRSDPQEIISNEQADEQFLNYVK
jgi:hypothetical protein